MKKRYIYHTVQSLSTTTQGVITDIYSIEKTQTDRQTNYLPGDHSLARVQTWSRGGYNCPVQICVEETMHLQEKNKVSKNGVKPPLKFGILKDSSGSRRIVFLAIEGGLNFRGKKISV